MNIIITGASGLLGSALLRAALESGHQCLPLERERLNWQDITANLPLFADADIIFHAAANTNVEQCEINPDDCYRDNLLLTEILARVAQLAKVRFVFISSTGIYGNSKQEPYKEYDPVSPTTHHHTSKYKAEQVVLQLNPNNLIIRTGWLFGGNVDNPKNFVARRLEEAKSVLATSGTIKANNQQYGVPCYTHDVATRLLLLAELGWAGVFNCVNSGRGSRFDYVSAIIKSAGLSVKVQPSDSADFKRIAAVSNNEMAENWKMDCCGLPTMPNWQDSLANYVRTIES